MTFKIIVIAASFVIFGCTSGRKKKHKFQFEQQTEDQFENIENEQLSERERLIEKYRLLRLQKQRRKIRVRPPKKRLYTKKKTIKKKRPAPKLTEEQLKSIKIEISQRQSFYCMEKRLSKEKCSTVTSKALETCQKSKGHQYSRKIISCLKKSLN